MRKILVLAISGMFAASLVHAAVGDGATGKAASPVAATAPKSANPEPAAAKLLPADLSLAQVIERNAAARGGAAAWQRIQTMTMSGRLDAGKQRRDGGGTALVDRRLAKAEGRERLRRLALGKAEGEGEKVIELPFAMELKRPAKSRIEIQFQGQTAVQVFDGTSGWKLRPFLGRHEVEPFAPAEEKAAAAQLPLDGPLINHEAKGIQVALEGMEAVEGRKAYRLKLTLKGGEVRRLWIDAETFLDSKIEGAPRRLDGREHPVATYFRDYKAVDGLMVAHTLETAVQGVRDTEKIHVERVALNPSLDESRFARPQ